MNRLGIFCITGTSEKIEKYVIYLLKEMKKELSDLILIISKNVRNEDLELLKEYSTKIAFLITENQQWNIKGDLIGWDSLVHQADEIVLINDSCYGPFFPIHTMWKDMERRARDFWGITGKRTYTKKTEEEELQYIHSYFIVISKKMFLSKEFRDFTYILMEKSNIEKALQYLEYNFCRYFSEYGYVGDTYIEDKVMKYVETEWFDNLELDSYQMLSKYNCPFIKKSSLIKPHEKVLEANLGETAKQTLDYISQYTAYDETLIWQDLIHNYDMGELRTALHLDYIFPSKGEVCQVDKKRKAAVIAHINYTELIGYCFSYLERIPDDIDIFITTKGEKNINIITQKLKEMCRTNIRIIVPEDRGREISALLVACKSILMKYEYLCFVHDKKNTKETSLKTVGQSMMDILWENTICNQVYIEQILRKMESDPMLGLLAPPLPFMSVFFSTGADAWSNCFEYTKKLAERLHIDCRMDKEKQPFVLGTTFWCRTDALQPLFKSGICYEDFLPEPMPEDGDIRFAIERILPYVAQSRGYYSGTMMTEDYASIYTCNCQHMLYHIFRKMLYDEGIEQYSDIHNMDNRINDFCMKFKKIYIYGTGICGKACLLHILKHQDVRVKGFIISEGHKFENEISGLPVFELSEIEPYQSEGIMLALNRQNMNEVVPALRNRGFANIGKYLEDSYELD